MVVQAAVVTGGIDRAERPGGGAGEKRVEVGHQPPLPHRVQHGPGRAIEAQDNQSIDGLRHGIVPHQPRLRADGLPSESSSAGRHRAHRGYSLAGPAPAPASTSMVKSAA